MKHYDFVSRHYRTRDGNKQWKRVERIKCPHCDHIVRILPSEIFIPFKHFSTIHIQRVLDRKEMNYPSVGNDTIQRWLKWFRDKISFILESISQVRKIQLTQVIEGSRDYLRNLKEQDSAWLSKIAFTCKSLGP